MRLVEGFLPNLHGYSLWVVYRGKALLPTFKPSIAIAQVVQFFAYLILTLMWMLSPHHKVLLEVRQLAYVAP